MTCPICDQKPMNCDCTPEERRQYSEIEDLEGEIERQRAERRWIPVGERLPEQREHVIGWGVNFARPAEVWIGGDGAWYCGDFEPAGDITYWMPLPDLPEVK